MQARAVGSDEHVGAQHLLVLLAKALRPGELTSSLLSISTPKSSMRRL
jgi:hypothetical protein